MEQVYSHKAGLEKSTLGLSTFYQPKQQQSLLNANEFMPGYKGPKASMENFMMQGGSD